MTSGSFNGQYDIVTWPGHLCITGDYGSYLFARTEDMFEFFRRDELEISPGYWSEKVLAQSIFGHGVEEFSVEKFTNDVIEWAIGDEKSKKKKAEIMEEIDDLLHCEDEWECVATMRDFSSKLVDFTDFWELDAKVYTFHFLWCLYAIVYAIQKYDEAKSQKTEVVS
jgi:hypothetical protein